MRNAPSHWCRVEPNFYDRMKRTMKTVNEMYTGARMDVEGKICIPAGRFWNSPEFQHLKALAKHRDVEWMPMDWEPEWPSEEER